MLLKEIKDLEYQLLLIEQDVTKIEFIDYLNIEAYLDELGKITTNYINFLEAYGKSLPHENAKEILIAKNEELLNTDILINKEVEIKNIIKKYKE